MTSKRHTRTEAWTLLNEYTQSPSLLKHALAVEACMGAYSEAEAATLGLSEEDAMELNETYRSTGLLHDFDYEKYPSAEQHPFVGNKILTEQGWPEEIREAIMGHAQYSGVPRRTHLAKTLFACDELAGFLTAVSLVKPTRSIFDVDVTSVRKKLKDKAFATRCAPRRHHFRRPRIRHGVGYPYRFLHRSVTPQRRCSGPGWHCGAACAAGGKGSRHGSNYPIVRGKKNRLHIVLVIVTLSAPVHFYGEKIRLVNRLFRPKKHRFPELELSEHGCAKQLLFCQKKLALFLPFYPRVMLLTAVGAHSKKNLPK